MSNKYEDPGWLYHLIVSAVMALVPGILFGVFVGLKERTSHGLLAGAVIFLAAWALLLYVARNEVRRLQSRL